MDFALTDSQQLLVTIARELLDKHRHRFDPGGRIGSQTAAPTRRLSDELWQEMASLGWPGLLIPPELGGAGGSMLDVVVLVEELGRAGLPGPYVSSAVAATTALLAAADAAQRRDRLPAMAVGDHIVALAVTEEGAALASERMRCALEVPEGEVHRGAAPTRAGRLEGTKRFVGNADLAHEILIVARSARGPTLVLVDKHRAGLEVVPAATLSGEPVFTIHCAGVEVYQGDLLGAPGDGWRLITPALQAGALARAAEMVGAAQRVLDLAVEHAKVRVQSGRPIGSFQAIQHACADLLRQVEGSRWIVRAAAWKFAEGLDAAADVAMAKAWAGEACLAAARRAHQIFGAIGYCDEHPLHLLHKRIHAASVEYGNAPAHLESVARAIGLRD